MAFEQYEMGCADRKIAHAYEENENSAGHVAAQMGYSQQLQEKFGLVSMIGFSCELATSLRIFPNNS